jgi:hypothetical protein
MSEDNDEVTETELPIIDTPDWIAEKAKALGITEAEFLESCGVEL